MSGWEIGADPTQPSHHQCPRSETYFDAMELPWNHVLRMTEDVLQPHVRRARSREDRYQLWRLSTSSCDGTEHELLLHGLVSKGAQPAQVASLVDRAKLLKGKDVLRRSLPTLSTSSISLGWRRWVVRSYY